MNWLNEPVFWASLDDPQKSRLDLSRLDNYDIDGFSNQYPASGRIEPTSFLEPFINAAHWVISEGLQLLGFSENAANIAAGGALLLAPGGKNVYIKGFGNVNNLSFHRGIKPNILNSAGNYSKHVGTNPNVFIQKGQIMLQGTGGGFQGKVYNTGLKATDFF